MVIPQVWQGRSAQSSRCPGNVAPELEIAGYVPLPALAEKVS